MPGWFILALICLAIGVIAILGGAIAKDGAAGIGVGVIFVIFFAIFTIISSANSVPIRTIGVVTSFGKPTGDTVGSGLHMIAPWKKLGDWNAAVITEDNTGGGFKDDAQTRCEGSTLVRIATGATACVESKVQWQVHRDANGKADDVAADQYTRYAGNFDSFRSNFFDTQLQNSLNEVFSQYNPVAAFTGTSDGTFDLSKVQSDVATELAKRTAGQVDVITVSIPIIHHDAKTEAQIKSAQDLKATERNLNQTQINTDLQNKITESKIKAKVSVQQQCIDNAVRLNISAGNCLEPGYAASGVVNGN